MRSCRRLSIRISIMWFAADEYGNTCILCKLSLCIWYGTHTSVLARVFLCLFVFPSQGTAEDQQRPGKGTVKSPPYETFSTLQVEMFVLL